MNFFNYVVVGAGPAGLAFASTIDDPSVLVIDSGKPVDERDRFNAQECIQGAGGAGLFSDGKFSFYPSGTHIWTQHPEYLRKGYETLRQDLGAFKDIPPFPEIDDSNKLEGDKAGWHLKPYESIYLDLEDRIQLISNLAKRCLNIQYQTEFMTYTPVSSGYEIQLKNLKDDTESTIYAQKIVFAGGRFMPLFLNCFKTFRRYEFGFRVEGPCDAIQKDVNLVDPKYIFTTQGVEYRTFCWCVNGEVVKTCFKDIETFSGRADCTPSGKSNFGFNIRVKDPSLLTAEDFKSLMYTGQYKTKFKDLYKTVSLSRQARKIIDYGIAKLKERFPGLNNTDIDIIGPTIEGVGEYPKIDNDFNLEGDPNISVIGDCSGIYRGIVASMLSGYVRAIKNNTQTTKENLCLSHQQ